jgi:MFS superfamily sulfate permease-like transporter
MVALGGLTLARHRSLQLLLKQKEVVLSFCLFVFVVFVLFCFGILFGVRLSTLQLPLRLPPRPSWPCGQPP